MESLLNLGKASCPTWCTE